MRLHRIRLRNFRGVADREVTFATKGVTVVDGPNESGKSSLLEALDLLLEEYDSAKSRKVLAVKPVHDDVGTEIEAEIESGPYRFVYAKTFFRKPGTTLRVLRPAAENLTGREAHERVEKILADTMDVDLWRALRIAQGGPLAPPDLSDKRWLAAALDRAGGGAADASGQDDSLVAAAEEEALRWWTATGQERRELADLAARVERLRAEASTTRAERDRVVADVTRADDLARDVARLTAAAKTTAAGAEEHEARLRAVESLRREEREAGHAAQHAKSALDAATADVAARESLKKAAADAAAALEALDRDAATAAPAADALAQQHAAAEAEATRLRTAAEAAAAAVALRRKDREHLHSVLEITQMTQRAERAAAATKEVAAAEAILAANHVDDATLKKLRKLRDEVVGAEALLKAAGGTLRVTAHRDIVVSERGADTAVAAGTTRDVAAVGGARIDVAGVVSVEFVSGKGTAEPQRDFETKRDAYRDALAAAGLPPTEGIDAALAANAARHEAERTRDDRRRELAVALDDLTAEKLEGKIRSLRARVEAWPRERPAEPPLPPDFDTAQDLERAAEKQATAAADALRTAEPRLRDLTAKLDEARQSIVKREGARSIRRQNADAAAAKLAEARAATSDEALAARLADATRAAAETATAHAAAVRAVADAGVERLEGLATNARRVAADTATQLATTRDALQVLRTSLEVRGEMGLDGTLDAKVAELSAAERDLASRRGAAAAAKLLLATLREEQAKVRARYIAPLRDRITGLGRFLYDASFGIELDEDLAIVSRTLASRTVPFDSLSGGAKEQLGVIARLAVAQIVEPDGGVPVILDDALGWSDPRRLEEIGALLSTAAKDSQVIVLTCQPDRYRSVGGATRVSLA